MEYISFGTIESRIKDLLKVYKFADWEEPNKFESKIKSLMSNRVAFLIWTYANKNNKQIFGNSIEDVLELVRLLQFFSKCEGSTIKLIGTISHPQKGDIIGSETKATISSNHIKKMLTSDLHKLLEQDSAGFIHWEFEHKDNKVFEKVSDYSFSAPYSEEELQIMCKSYEESIKRDNRLTKNGKLGELAYRIDSILTTKKNMIETRKTKRYSFIYDIMLYGGITGKNGYIGEGFSGIVGREKFQFVNNWINAYNRDLKSNNNIIAEFYD